MPIVYELMSCFFGILAGGIAGGIAFLASSLLFFLRIKSKPKAFLLTLGTTIVSSALIFCVVTFFFLNASFRGPPSPKGRPNDSDITGVWQLSVGSMEKAQTRGYRSSIGRIEFADHGIFRMIDIPDVVFNYWEPKNKLLSGTGNWAIDRDTVNNEWDVQVHVLESNDSNTSWTTHFEIYGEAPPYSIYRWDGDPDSSSTWSFDRQ